MRGKSGRKSRTPTNKNLFDNTTTKWQRLLQTFHEHPAAPLIEGKGKGKAVPSGHDAARAFNARQGSPNKVSSGLLGVSLLLLHKLSPHAILSRTLQLSLMLPRAPDAAVEKITVRPTTRGPHRFRLRVNTGGSLLKIWILRASRFCRHWSQAYWLSCAIS